MRLLLRLDAALRERDEAKQNHLRECAKCSALADKVISLKARVAELEAAPQPASGWLTAEEREEIDQWIASLADAGVTVKEVGSE
ncbi:hypothetical protein UFOVP1124_46 [uncultured Caudovirales phage]|uniref:Uncharacterized protein n=1 Tax=uncultured Caudovirales phage TaxID=2100421 RepID=A0A6J5QJR0_9CAUD|nr:hypothetical protein UFOVP1124_46 [uncultured Caudovirales phage]